MSDRVILCETDDRDCTCGGKRYGVPSGMHHVTCPTNPVSRSTKGERDD